jgi:NlpC/P60 family
MRFIVSLLLLFCLFSCNNPANNTVSVVNMDSVVQADTIKASYVSRMDPAASQVAPNSERCDLVDYAETFMGTPYRYGSKDPSVGFDCSGFIDYVFTHFNITVPRSSVEYTNLGNQVTIPNAKPGDLILFTGTDSTVRVVGHIGIVTENVDTLKFIQATSGKAYSVVITPLDRYYQSRFMKIIDILPGNAAAPNTVVVNKVEDITSETTTTITKTITTRTNRHHLKYHSLRKHHQLTHGHRHSTKMHHSVKLHKHLSKTHHHLIKAHHKHR